MNYWLHRISHHAEVSYPLLERGVLSIGWSDFSNKSFVDAVSNNKDIFEKEFTNDKWNLPRSRHSLWRFISEMKKDDFVLVPSWGTFSVYKVLSEKAFCAEDVNVKDLKDWYGNNIIKGKNGLLYHEDDSDSSNRIDLGFFLMVERIAVNINRSEYADQALTARMKIRQANGNISDLKENIEQAIEAFNLKEPINLHALIHKKAKEEVLLLIRSKLNADKFERLVQWYLKKAGATNVDIPPKNDPGKEAGDADIIGTFEPIKTIIYVQAKYHIGVTDIFAFEQINDYKSSKQAIDDGYAIIRWVVSSADSFSEDCKKEAAANAHIILIDGPSFASMLLEIGISSLDDAFK